MRIEGIRLLEKHGGKSGHYRRAEDIKALMALLPVADALQRVLAGAAPLPPRRVPLTDARRPRAGRGRRARSARSRRPMSPPWTATRCAPPMSRPCRSRSSVIGEVAAGHPFDGRGRRRRGRAHLHRRRAAARRRHHRDPGKHRARRRPRHRRAQPAAKGRNIRAPGIDFNARRRAACARDAPDRPRRDAGRRHEPCRRCRCIAGPKVAVLGTGDELVPPGSDARPGRDRLFQRLRADGAGAGAKAPRRIDLGIAPRPARRTSPPPSARRATAAPTSWSRPAAPRSATTTWCSAALARRRAGPVVLAGRAAARPADDARPARRDAGARPARQSGVVLRLRVPVPGAADPAACRAAADSSRPASRRVLGRDLPGNDERAGLSARGADDRPRWRRSPLRSPAQDSSMMAPLAARRMPRDPRAARARRGGRFGLCTSLSSRPLAALRLVHSKLKGCGTHIEQIVSVHDLFLG